MERSTDNISPISLGDKIVGGNAPVLFIAEAGVNHNGSLDLAFRLVDAAVEAKADVVKFQTFRTERVASQLAATADYQRRNGVSDESQSDMIRRLELSEADHRAILEYSRSRNIIFTSTPFDEESADLLETLEVPFFKLSSGDLTNHPLLRHLANKGRPVILSTGMANISEIGQALQVLAPLKSGIALLHCVSNYPVEPENANLKAMDTLSREFPTIPIGFSDHTLGIEVALAAVARGACVIEKHLTLDRNLPGPDHAASLEPADFKEMIRRGRLVESCLGSGKKECSSIELQNRELGRRSLYWTRDIDEGTRVEASDFIALRPAIGISPSDLDRLVGSVTARPCYARSLVKPEDF